MEPLRWVMKKSWLWVAETAWGDVRIELWADGLWHPFVPALGTYDGLGTAPSESMAKAKVAEWVRRKEWDRAGNKG